MDERRRIRLYDAWAPTYDERIEAGSAPPSFEGYGRVLRETVLQAQAAPGMRVLDLGTGTGNLAARFVRAGCEVWGIDFSIEMLHVAKSKLPALHTVRANLADAWPEVGRFDRVVSSYALHDLDLAAKVALLSRVTEAHLEPDGRIVIADVAYLDREARAQARTRWGRMWDEGAHYWAADETVDACRDIGLSCTYVQVSGCGGVFVMQREVPDE